MNPKWNNSNVTAYLNSVQAITAYGLSKWAKVPKQTAADIIKRFVQSGHLRRDGTLKVKGQRKPIPRYKLTMEIITYDKIANDFLKELKERRNKLTPNDSDSSKGSVAMSPNDCHESECDLNEQKDLATQVAMSPNASTMSPNATADAGAMSPNDIICTIDTKLTKETKSLDTEYSCDSDSSDAVQVLNDKVTELERIRINPLAEFEKVFGK